MSKIQKVTCDECFEDIPIGNSGPCECGSSKFSAMIRLTDYIEMKEPTVYIREKTILPTDDDGKIDYNMLQYFWEKHGDLTNYGEDYEVLAELNIRNPALGNAYSTFIAGRDLVERILEDS